MKIWRIHFKHQAAVEEFWKRYGHIFTHSNYYRTLPNYTSHYSYLLTPNTFHCWCDVWCVGFFPTVLLTTYLSSDLNTEVLSVWDKLRLSLMQRCVTHSLIPSHWTEKIHVTSKRNLYHFYANYANKIGLALGEMCVCLHACKHIQHIHTQWRQPQATDENRFITSHITVELT